MKNLLTNKYINFLARLLTGAIFLYAGLAKLSDLSGFARDIANYLILPSFLVNLTAIILPWLEIFCGLFLIFGIFVPAAGTILLCLLIFFTAATASVIVRGLDLSCGCFGTGEPVGWFTILRDMIFILLAALSIKKENLLFSLKNHFKD